MPEMTAERFAQIEALDKAATRGPWYARWKSEHGRNLYIEMVMAQHSGQLVVLSADGMKFADACENCDYVNEFDHPPAGFRFRNHEQCLLSTTPSPDLDFILDREAVPELLAEVRRLRAELAAEQGLRLAMERQALGTDDAGRARVNDAKDLLREVIRKARCEPWPKLGILADQQVGKILEAWSRVIGSRDAALKEAHAARREAELGRQQLQEFIAADVENLKLVRLDYTGLLVAQEKSYATRLLFWSLYDTILPKLERP